MIIFLPFENEVLFYDFRFTILHTESHSKNGPTLNRKNLFKHFTIPRDIEQCFKDIKIRCVLDNSLINVKRLGTTKPSILSITIDRYKPNRGN